MVPASRPSTRTIFWATGGIALAGVLLVCSLAILFRENLLRWWLNPSVPYQVYSPPRAPDYAGSASWAAFGVPSGTAEAPLYDLFLLAPTLYARSAEWNAPTDDPGLHAAFDQIVVRTLAPAFARGARLYVPYWRQATLYTMWSHAEDSRKARALAYSDTRRALSAYLDATPPGRPVVMVGFGQGGQHLLRLLGSDFDGRLKGRLVVAYVLGQPAAAEPGELGVPLCKKADDTGCLAAWTTLASDEDREPVADRSMIWRGDELLPTKGIEFSCLNPLLWSREEASAPQAMNLGGRALGPTSGDGAELQLGAQCSDGLLVVDGPVAGATGLLRWPGTDLRLIDLAPFYENVRANVATRLAIYLAAGRAL